METLYYYEKDINNQTHLLVRNKNELVFLSVNETLDDVRKKFKKNPLIESDLGFEEVIKQLEEYYLGNRKEFSFTMKPIGTPFQMGVWNILQQIPYGELWNYSQVAAAYGDEKKVRAVANAIGANPLLIVIPCHRVIGKDGKLHGFRSGLDMKKTLIEVEGGNPK